MTRALQSGVSGLLAHQVQMDSVGNNIANASTIGFKGGHALFADTLYQTLRPASAPTPSSGGVNPSAVGSGVQVAGIGTDFSQGALQATGHTTDVAIDGEGFLAVTDGQGIYFTRNGALGLDQEGSLVHLATGMRVLATPDGAAPATVDASSTLIAPVGQASVARATSQVELGGNLDSRLAAGGSQTVTAQVYDSLGAPHRLALTFTPGATPGMWDIQGTSADGAVGFSGPAQVHFDPSGASATPSLTMALTLDNPRGASPDLSLTLGLGGLTQLAQSGTAALSSQDGATPGTLTGLAIQNDGAIAGNFSNGLSRTVGRLVTAVFANVEGLDSVGDSLFQATANSGEPVFGAPGDGRGAIKSGYLEGSNVDLADEFTRMIVTQRGYQASSRILSTADEMLQELLQVLR